MCKLCSCGNIIILGYLIPMSAYFTLIANTSQLNPRWDGGGGNRDYYIQPFMRNPNTHNTPKTFYQEANHQNLNKIKISYKSSLFVDI